jgi:rRNA pseudouridine-1189 N-methylase Emg1 (Nep1/Mra1 family)
MLPKLRRVLRTPQSTYRFLDLVASVFDGIDRRLTDEGILIVKPVQLTEPVESSGTESVVEPLSPISDVVAEADQEPM